MNKKSPYRNSKYLKNRRRKPKKKKEKKNSSGMNKKSHSRRSEYFKKYKITADELTEQYERNYKNGSALPYYLIEYSDIFYHYPDKEKVIELINQKANIAFCCDSEEDVWDEISLDEGYKLLIMLLTSSYHGMESDDAKVFADNLLSLLDKPVIFYSNAKIRGKYGMDINPIFPEGEHIFDLAIAIVAVERIVLLAVKEYE